MEVIIREQGNGLPGDGDYCAGNGQLYEIQEITSPIHTGDRPGEGDYFYATVEEVEWDACTEDEQHSAQVELIASDED